MHCIYANLVKLLKVKRYASRISPFKDVFSKLNNSHCVFVCIHQIFKTAVLLLKLKTSDKLFHINAICFTNQPCSCFKAVQPNKVIFYYSKRIVVIYGRINAFFAAFHVTKQKVLFCKKPFLIHFCFCHVLVGFSKREIITTSLTNCNSLCFSRILKPVTKFWS